MCKYFSLQFLVVKMVDLFPLSKAKYYILLSKKKSNIFLNQPLCYAEGNYDVEHAPGAAHPARSCRLCPGRKDGKQLSRTPTKKQKKSDK